MQGVTEEIVALSAAMLSNWKTAMNLECQERQRDPSLSVPRGVLSSSEHAEQTE